MTPLVSNFTDIFSFAVLLLDLVAAALFVILITPLKRKGWTKNIADFVGERAILLSFLVAFGGLVGSLFYSEVAHFAPCVLCWWQRVFLYPQVVLLFVALIKRHENIRVHALALSGIGGLIALYHTFIQFGGASVLPCAASGVSCTTLYFLEYGYITIPTMSLTVFALILLFMAAPNPKNRDIREL